MKTTKTTRRTEKIVAAALPLVLLAAGIVSGYYGLSFLAGILGMAAFVAIFAGDN